MFYQEKVQKKNKSSNLNGFTLLAIEFSGRTVQEGEQTFITQKQISRAKPVWDKLTESKRQEYKDRAKALKAKTVNTQNRYNSLGQNIVDVEVSKELLEEEKNRRRNEIEQILKDAADISELDSKVFFILSASYFYEDESSIYPAEIGIAKFSLKDGVFNTLSFEINPGDLPVGSAYKAQQISESSHKYPLPPDSFGETNYIDILLKIIDFLPADRKIPTFYTEGSSENSEDFKILENTQRILKLIFEKAQEYDVARDLKTYPITELFYYLKQITVEIKNEQDPNCKEVPFNSIFDAENAFKRSEFEFRHNTSACEYHDKNDAHHECCLSKCTRYGYIISKWCAQGFKYKLKSGCHFPKSYKAFSK